MSAPWRAPLCRREDAHREVEHNDDALAKLGKECACFCHRVPDETVLLHPTADAESTEQSDEIGAPSVES